MIGFAFGSQHSFAFTGAELQASNMSPGETLEIARRAVAEGQNIYQYFQSQERRIQSLQQQLDVANADSIIISETLGNGATSGQEGSDTLNIVIEQINTSLGNMQILRNQRDVENNSLTARINALHTAVGGGNIRDNTTTRIIEISNLVNENALLENVPLHQSIMTQRNALNGDNGTLATSIMDIRSQIGILGPNANEDLANQLMILFNFFTFNAGSNITIQAPTVPFISLQSLIDYISDSRGEGVFNTPLI